MKLLVECPGSYPLTQIIDLSNTCIYVKHKSFILRDVAVYCSSMCSQFNGQTCSNTHAHAIKQDSENDP